MLSGLIIRPIESIDLKALEWEGEFTHFRRMYLEAYRRSEKGDAVIWIAELPQVGIIGQLFISLKSDRLELADGVTRAYIYALRVRPAYRRMGVGTRLIQNSETDLFKRGFRHITLNVSRDNLPALHLYKRLGYRIVAADPGRWSYLDEKGFRHDVHEPAWRMEKMLTPPK